MDKKNIKKNLSVCVIFGLKKECPIYLEYNIAKYLQRAAFLLPDIFLLVFPWQQTYKVPYFHFVFFQHVFFKPVL